jgi:hypothetical protein
MNDRKSTTSRLSFAMAAATVAVLVVMPIAWANGASGPVATKSASLVKQVKSLKKRVAALEGRQTGNTTTNNTTNTTAAPIGPAGGDLAGTYPTIGLGTVTGPKDRSRLAQRRARNRRQPARLVRDHAGDRHRQ